MDGFMRYGRVALAVVGGLLLGGTGRTAGAADVGTSPLPGLAERGGRTMELIERAYAVRGREGGRFYLEGLRPGDAAFRPQTVLAWGVGLQFSALNAAARAEPAKYRAAMAEYAKSVRAYWFVDKNGLGGFTAAAHSPDADRYYDDNAWICLDYCEAFELTGDRAMLDTARQTFAFMLTGRDDKLGGGIYWYERKKTTKNTCINAPAAVCALRLAALTGEAAYVDTAKQLYAWTKTHLQDPADGLYFDSVDLSGHVDRRKFSYNTALMLRAACLLHERTGERAYLDEAGRLAKAAEAHWLRPDGSADDVSYFGHLLIEAMLDYGQRTGDRHWADVARRTCDYLWQTNRRADGHFPERWDGRDEHPQQCKLMWDASNARLFFRVAEADKALRTAGGGG